MNNNNITVSILKEIVEKAGSQRKLARELGVSHSAVSNWMYGSPISLERAVQISEMYNVPLEFLHPPLKVYEEVLNKIKDKQ